jgi:hypothetical protein
VRLPVKKWMTEREGKDYGNDGQISGLLESTDAICIKFCDDAYLIG